MAIRAEGMWRSSRKSKENDEWDRATGRLSERLLLAAEGAWQEAMKKQFLLEMADGTLSPERFRYYMLIDYLYLTEYIKTLRIIEERSDEPEIGSFLQDTIGATEEELGRVHFPNMMQLGITEEDIAKTAMPRKAENYIRYMRGLALERPILESLTALLDCSWAYAYIAEHMIERYGEMIQNSRYRDWFMARTRIRRGSTWWIHWQKRLMKKDGRSFAGSLLPARGMRMSSGMRCIAEKYKKRSGAVHTRKR